MSSLRCRASALALSTLAAACAAAEPPPAPPPSIVVAAALPEAPPTPPPPPAMLVIPGAERSARPIAEPSSPHVPALRSEGKRHGLRRTRDGVVISSAEGGVIGLLRAPVKGAEIRWAGFVEEDAVLAATPGALHRAATPADAVAGKWEAIAGLDPAASRFASAGKIVVAAAPGEAAALLESRDGGRTFQAVKRPGEGPIAELTVRSDGWIVVALERDVIVNAAGVRGHHVKLFAAKRSGAWTAGPMAREIGGSALSHYGDSIVVFTDGKKGDDIGTVGLDAQGRWIETELPDDWLPAPWTSAHFHVSPPRERPGFPKRAARSGGVIGGLLGGGGGRERCNGATCLRRRTLATSPASVRAFPDAVCAKEDVVTRVERLPMLGATEVVTECKDTAPARRGAALLVRGGDDPLVARLPITCAEGRILGTDRASFAICSPKHRGRPALLHVSPAGAITEVAAAPAVLSPIGAESATDGTTLVFAHEAVWLCTPDAPPACSRIGGDDLLTARPQPGGRALVARRGASNHEVLLEILHSGTAAPALKVALTENLLDLEVTGEGEVRLWTSPKLEWPESVETMARKKDEIGVAPYRVRADGKLVPDAAAMDALRAEVEAARSKR